MTHKELNESVTPIIDAMNENDFTYMLIAGKNGDCMRYVKGDMRELYGMIMGLAEKHEQFAQVLKDIVERLNSENK